ncbi:DUF2179 domain-containing protein [Thermosediminibacter oceani]|uniref:UPF0316 protein Toce_1785 n=1 Tax=Thermosediminibacter oceani (strain ATCC BAA-1034 / DSM 16646 / JW/IW-1228P) TaxID=555079 RepID=D9RYU5_THEOJ|nr:DUF2179 domain-containing protein [Thermosediminibacter oceani]ADL08519.1 Protein of unknown function DUF2179 [Thermosediminibacter oceani DSM 16646]
MTPLLGYLFIFIARVCDVSLSTLRTLMVVRGHRMQAAVMGFFEVIIYITALNQVVGKLGDPLNLIAYALGFATGNYVGSLLEEKLALGLTTVQVITQNPELPEKIRSRGFGVTMLQGMGKEGTRHVLVIYLARKNVPALINLIESEDESAFITIMDMKSAKGGYFKQAK